MYCTAHDNGGSGGGKIPRSPPYDLTAYLFLVKNTAYYKDVFSLKTALFFRLSLRNVVSVYGMFSLLCSIFFIKEAAMAIINRANRALRCITVKLRPNRLPNEKDASRTDNEAALADVGASAADVGKSNPRVGKRGSGSRKRGSDSPERGSDSSERGSGSRKRGSGSPERGSDSRKHGSGSPERETGSRKRGSGSRKRGSGSSERGSGSRKRGSGSPERGMSEGCFINANLRGFPKTSVFRKGSL
jgi:hypothetical protein